MNVPTARKIASKPVITLDQLSTYQQAKNVIRKTRKRRKAHAKRTSR